MVDSCDKVVIQRDGELVDTAAHFHDLDHALQIARTLALKVSDRPVNASNPIVTSELDRARITIMVDKIVRSGIVVTIRKFRSLLGMPGLLGFGALSPEMGEFLADAVRARATM